MHIDRLKLYHYPASRSARVKWMLHEVVGDGFEVTGWSVVDELPEALEDPSRRFALGVQWHPEADPTSREIAALVEAAR